jgi:hypothetical protein
LRRNESKGLTSRDKRPPKIREEEPESFGRI